MHLAVVAPCVHAEIMAEIRASDLSLLAASRVAARGARLALAEMCENRTIHQPHTIHIYIRCGTVLTKRLQLPVVQ